MSLLQLRKLGWDFKSAIVGHCFKKRHLGMSQCYCTTQNRSFDYIQKWYHIAQFWDIVSRGKLQNGREEVFGSCFQVYTWRMQRKDAGTYCNLTPWHLSTTTTITFLIYLSLWWWYDLNMCWLLLDCSESSLRAVSGWLCIHTSPGNACGAIKILIKDWMILIWLLRNAKIMTDPCALHTLVCHYV